MNSWVKPTLVVVVLFAAIQVVRPAHTNPPTDVRRAFQAQVGPGVVSSVIDRSCRDCHSNETTWPWYSHVAPVSWLIAHDVNDGREALNFSDWAGYLPDKQRKLLSQACDEVREGEMPGFSYTFVHREARLTTEEVTALCALPGTLR